MEADDQAIQTILMDPPDDIYVVVDSCETAQEIWLRVQQMMKGSDIRIQEKKRLSCLMNGNVEVNQLRAERLAKTHDPLTLMEYSNNPYNYPVFYQDQPSQMQMAGGNGRNQFRQYAGQNVKNHYGYNAVPNVRNQANLQQASTSGTQIDKVPVYDSDGSAEVHHDTNCYDNDIFNMFTQEEQYTKLLDTIPEPHQVQQNDSNVIYANFSVEQSGGTIEQYPATVEKTCALYDLLYNNLAIEVEKVNTVNRKIKK
nr:hypothetical protein [Tanacetum cinerariifolium]